MYKQIGKVRESLIGKGYEKDIPIEIFGKELMLMFGMRKQKAVEWTHTFEEVNLIKIDDINNKVNFV